MLLIYNLLFPFAFLFFIPGMIYKLIRRPGSKDTYLERFASYSKEKEQLLRESKGAIWIHSVSVGETVISLNLIKKWQKLNQDRRFILSTTTTTGQELARNKAPENVPIIFCPIDFSPFVKKLIRISEPSALVIFETEIWPNMINLMHARKAPVALVNARISDRSVKGYLRFKTFFLPILEKFSLACVQTEDDRSRFASIAPNLNLEVPGNMKFDQEIPDKLPEVDLTECFGTDENIILLAASTHPGEEQLIAETCKKLKPEFASLTLVIVPRHAERGTEIHQIITNPGIPFHSPTNSAHLAEPVDC